MIIPMVLRGDIIEDRLITHEGRRGGFAFSSPACASYLSRLVLSTPSAIQDLYRLAFDDILDYLVALGARLNLEENSHLRQALDISKRTSGLPDSVLESAYRNMHRLFDRTVLREIAEQCVGIGNMEGWVSSVRKDGRKIHVRAFGARAVHIVAGNLPEATAVTIVRNALTRSDALIKTPSNDPMTAVAIVRTMVEMAPDHPLTRHVAVAYWRGGDESVEALLYQPRHVEKIIARGGFASVKHITKYLQPGIDLITLDPKLSASIVGKDVFASEQNFNEVAFRLATDIAAYNQEACLSARVIYVECGMDAPSLERINALAGLRRTYVYLDAPRWP